MTAIARNDSTRRPRRIRRTRRKRVLKGFVPFVVFVSFVFVFSSAGDAGAQDLRLSLTEAQDRAVAASHRLAEARARAATADAVVAVREAADQPIVGLGAGYTRTNHVVPFAFPGPGGRPMVVYPDAPNNYRTRLDLQWPIYSGGRTDALERAAQAEASAAAADVAVAQSDLRLEVARAFWALVTARAAAAVLDRSLARAQANVADVRERLNAGLIPPNEVASAEAQESRQRMLLIESRNQADQSSAELARLIGENVLQRIEPAADLDLGGMVTLPFEGLVADARSTRDERRAIEHRIAAAEEQVAAAVGSRRPSVAITGGFDYARPNPHIFPRADRWDESWDAGVSATWAFWDGGRARAEAAQARTLVDASRQRLAEFDSVIALDIRQRLLDIDSGRAALAAADDAVRAATEARRVVTERNRAGVAIQTDVLDADVVLLQAELDRTRAIAGVRFAEARLARALGK
jgi:outer membrane protein